MIIELCIAIMFGLCFGSFNTLLIHRLPVDKPVVATRSRCPSCHTVLRARDLVPVFSWLCHMGKCAHCGVSIHWRYPVTELVTAAFFALSWYRYGMTFDALLLALLASQIVVLCVIDIEHRIIPDILQITMAVTGIAYGIVAETHIADMLLGMLLGGIIGYALQQGFKLAMNKDGLGTGDVKFMVVAGIWLGAAPLPTFLFYSGVLGVLSALLWKTVHPDPRFPFGPALAISLLLLVLYPPSLQWYQQLLFAIAGLFISI